MEIGGALPHSCPIQFAAANNRLMKTNAPKPSAPIALALALALALASTGQSQAQACLDNRQIQEAVLSGEIQSLPQVLAAAGIDSSVAIPNPVRVCDEGGRLVYILDVLSEDGQIQTITLNAQ